MARRARGEGTLHRRKDGRWEGKLRTGARAGRLARKSFYDETRQDVTEQMRRYAARHALPMDLDLTLKEYLEQWLADGDWRANTYRLRRHAVDRHIVPHIGARRVADLDVDDVKVLLRKLKELEVGTATRKQVHATLNAALNALFRERKILFNPCSLVSAPRYEPKEKVVLDRYEAKRLMEMAEGQTQVLVIMAATLGMREGELFGLVWGCVDLEKRTVAIVRQLTEDAAGRLTLGPLKTKASRRTLELPELTLRALRAWHSIRRADGYNGPLVFTDSQGNRCARVTSSGAPSSRYCAAPNYPRWTFTRCAIPPTHSSLRRVPTPFWSRDATATSTHAWCSTVTVTCSREHAERQPKRWIAFSRPSRLVVKWSSKNRMRFRKIKRRFQKTS
jgi:integrase